MNNKALKIVIRIVKIIAIIVAIFALTVVITQKVTKNKFKIFGYGVYTVISESMLPEYEVGDMFLGKEIAEEDIQVGDDVVYLGEVDSYQGKIITHRVIKIDETEPKVFHTMGINNKNMEDPPIEYRQIYGKVAYKFVILSLFSKLMNNNVLFFIIIFVPFTILVFFDTKDLFKGKNKKKEKEEIKEEEKEENKE